MVELLAAHYSAALEYEEEFAARGPALDGLRRKTLEYARAAGQRAFEVGQMEAATEWMRIVVEQSRELGGSPTEHAARVVEYLEVGWAFEPYEVKSARIDEGLEMLDAMPNRAESDRKLEASLRQWQAYAHYESSGDAAAARASIQAGLQVLDGIGPCAERASLLHRLGWLAWRAGPATNAQTPLEAALSEARAAGSARLERWALHDLGFARRWTGSRPEGTRLLQRSMELAQQANDRALLFRCYANLGAVLAENGEFRQAIPMWEEGLERARRSMDRNSTLWLGSNLAEALSEMGRLDEALLLHDEVLAAARAMGIGHFGLIYRCWTLLQMGRLNEARATWEEIRSDKPEPQHRPRWASLPAALGWADDPGSGVAAMRATAEYGYHITSLLARMALRTGHHDGLRLAADSLLDELLVRDAGDSPPQFTPDGHPCCSTLIAQRPREAWPRLQPSSRRWSIGCPPPTPTPMRPGSGSVLALPLTTGWAVRPRCTLHARPCPCWKRCRLPSQAHRHASRPQTGRFSSVLQLPLAANSLHLVRLERVPHN